MNSGASGVGVQRAGSPEAGMGGGGGGWEGEGGGGKGGGSEGEGVRVGEEVLAGTPAYFLPQARAQGMLEILKSQLATHLITSPDYGADF